MQTKGENIETDKILILLWDLERTLIKYDEENGHTTEIFYKKNQKKELAVPSNATQ